MSTVNVVFFQKGKKKLQLKQASYNHSFYHKAGFMFYFQQYFFTLNYLPDLSLNPLKILIVKRKSVTRYLQLNQDKDNDF